MPNGMSPGRLTAMPSAMVDLASMDTGYPAASEPGHGATASAWTLTTSISGSRFLTATVIPAARPPPPTGTTIVRTCGHCTLNEPVRCRFSHLRKTGPARASESTREWSTGVSEITSWTILWAAVTSSELTAPGVVATQEVCHSSAGAAPATRTAPDAKTRNHDILSNGAATQAGRGGDDGDGRSVGPDRHYQASRPPPLRPSLIRRSPPSAPSAVGVTWPTAIVMMSRVETTTVPGAGLTTST